MVPAPRLWLILAPLALCIAAAPVQSVFLFLAIIAALLAALIFWLDLRISAGPRDVVAERHVADKLSLGVDNIVTILMRNGSAQRLVVLLRDEPPLEFGKPGPLLTLTAAPLGEATATYTVRPDRRGDYTFARVNARWQTRLGLLWRQTAWPLAESIKVYPNLLQVRRYEAALRRGLLHEEGLRRVRRRGQGSEFERLREYERDDDYRRINWPATARLHVPIVAEHEIERAQHVLVLLDVGRTMGAIAERGETTLSKLDHAVNAALMLAYVCQRRGDRVGLLAFSDRVVAFSPPAPGKRQFLRLLEILYNVRVEAVEADLGEAVQFMERRSRRRSLVVLFTDVLDLQASEAVVQHLSRLARRHVPLCVVMGDPDVAEAVGGVPLDSQDVYQRAVALELLEQRSMVLTALRSSDVLTIDVPADRLTPAVVDTYLELKARGRL